MSADPLQLLMDSVSHVIDETKDTLAMHKLKIKQVDLKVQTKTEEAVDAGVSFNIVVGTGNVKKGKTQTLSLSLVPTPHDIMWGGMVDPTKDLIKGIEAISKAVGRVASLVSGFQLNEAKVELAFELLKDASGNISFVIVAGGSVSKDNINVITIILKSAEQTLPQAGEDGKV